MLKKAAKDLRLLRKKILHEIIEKDLAGEMATEALMLEWSNAADNLIAAALSIVQRHFDSKEPMKFCVVALGKLGSQELNYSSDIDILFIYEGDLEASSRIASRLSKLLGDVTEDGFVFRVDTDLRPEGRHGPLVNTIEALERYYERRGQEWERQTLIRARPCAGDIELGKKFILNIQPFVYRKSIDLDALKKIRATKLALEKTAEKQGGHNIKLGAGGIREFEFFVHTLQLLHGGRIADLRTSSTFRALDALKKHKILSNKQHAELEEIYIFLRRTENLIQADHDLQTHVLPSNPHKLNSLAEKLGLKSSGLLINKLDSIMRRMQEYFMRLFETSYEKSEILEAMQANIETCGNMEEIMDSLPWFKNHTTKHVQALDLEGKLTPDEVSERLTFLAETIIEEALKITRHKLGSAYGVARTDDSRPAEIAIIALGKFGAFEMDYGSDLDIVFVYSGDGETDGAKKITNHEYFTKLAQGIISIINLPTRYGRAYDIDTKLRPSGNQGVLVVSLEGFERYHTREASLWEREAMLRARVVTGDATLKRRLNHLIDTLTFEPPLPHDIKGQIDDLRKKVIREKKSGDIKNGSGGLADIEATLHYLQLVHGQKNTKARNKKLSSTLDNLYAEKIIQADEYDTLNKAYRLYRLILSRSRLFGAHASDTVDPCAEYFQTLSVSLGFSSNEECLGKLEKLRDGVRKIYLKHLST